MWEHKTKRFGEPIPESGAKNHSEKCVLLCCTIFATFFSPIEKKYFFLEHITLYFFSNIRNIKKIKEIKKVKRKIKSKSSLVFVVPILKKKNKMSNKHQNEQHGYIRVYDSSSTGKDKMVKRKVDDFLIWESQINYVAVERVRQIILEHPRIAKDRLEVLAFAANICTDDLETALMYLYDSGVLLVARPGRIPCFTVIE